jgi:hypothetical protein
MAIIPFGLVGTIYGHALWDVPLSMFTVVGLLGMTGIIINDSIVLVTTIDEYAEDRGLTPSIIDGAADRLRPVLLTTLTTVLGLTPLLYEQSQQAQFLKPTVITLVYGWGLVWCWFCWWFPRSWQRSKTLRAKLRQCAADCAGVQSDYARRSWQDGFCVWGGWRLRWGG